MRLFGIDIATEVNSAVTAAGGVLDATLIKLTPATRTAGELAGGTNATSASYACKGFREAVANLAPLDLTQQQSSTVYLLGASIASGAVPVAGDKVTIESATYTITVVERDPAAAVYKLTVSGP